MPHEVHARPRSDPRAPAWPEPARNAGSREVVGGAHTVQERQIRLVEIARPPGQQRGVERDDQRGVTRPPSARFRKLRVTSRSFAQYSWNQRSRVAHRLGDLLHRGAGGGGQDVRDALRRGGPGGGGLRVRMHDRQHADRRERQRRGQRAAQHLDGQVAFVRHRAACAARSGAGPAPPGWRAPCCRRPRCPPHSRPDRGRAAARSAPPAGSDRWAAGVRRPSSRSDRSRTGSRAQCFAIRTSRLSSLRPRCTPSILATVTSSVHCGAHNVRLESSPCDKQAVRSPGTRPAGNGRRPAGGGGDRRGGPRTGPGVRGARRQPAARGTGHRGLGS